MNHVLLFAMVTLMTANHISAYCFGGAPPTIALGEHPEPNVCHYNGQTYNKGDTWDTGNCEECTCESQGAYFCCGYGFHAGVMSYGDDCKVIQFDCNHGIVWHSDYNNQCDMAGHEIDLTK